MVGAGAPFILINNYGLEPDTYGVIWFIPVVFNFLGSLLASRITVQVGGDRMVILGNSIVALAGLLLLYFAWTDQLDVVTIIIPTCMILFGLANSFPSASQGAVSLFPAKAATAAGLNGFIQMMMSAGAVTLLGRMADGTAMPMVYLVATCPLIGLVAFLLLRRRPAKGAKAAPAPNNPAPAPVGGALPTVS